MGTLCSCDRIGSEHYFTLRCIGRSTEDTPLRGA